MPADKARNQQLWGFALVVVGLALQVLFFYILLAHSESGDRTLELLPVGSLLCMIGLGVAARAKGRTVWWFLLGGAFPIVGPTLGLSFLLLDHIRGNLASKRSGLLWEVSGSIFTAAFLYVFDALVLGQGGIAGLTFFVLVFVLIPRTFRARRDPASLKQHAAKVAIYGVMVVATFATISFDNHLAHQRATELIAACNQYYAQYKKYPDTLQDLVPEFVPEIPAAKYSLLSSSFRYRVSEQDHVLMYIQIFPFGRAFYTLEEGRWWYLD